MNRSMTVIQLASYLSGVFDDEELLHDITLIGEVVEVSYSDRHTFLTLAENDYSVRCVHFSSRDQIKKGERISLKGSVRFYGKRTSVTFSYTEFFVSGAGDKNAKLNELKEKLCMLGYFENRPKLPKYVCDVVAVTSPDGAAIRDFIRVVSDKNPYVRIRVYPTKVQGDGAAAGIKRAVERLQRVKTDAIVLCRGGGSDEDLDCFNDEELAITVANSKIPVISAVGHEIDFTLCDFCAGTRAGTPSIAGEIVNEHASALVNDIAQLAFRARAALDRQFERRKTRLERVSDELSKAVGANIAVKVRELLFSAQKSYYAVQKKLESANGEVKSLSVKMCGAAQKVYDKKRMRTEKLSAVLFALDPKRIIGSGYAAVTLDGKTVKSVSSLSAGNNVRLIFADGAATAKIASVDK